MLQPRAEDAPLAYACGYAEAAFQAVSKGTGAALEETPLDVRLAAAFELHGFLTAQDAVFRGLPIALGEKRVFYGWVLERNASPGSFVAVVRGTITLIEWFEDCEGAPEEVDFGPRSAHPIAGEVESGFWGIYQSMRFRHPGGADLPVAAALSAIVGSGTLTSTGHSLGAPLASYLAFDAADPGQLGSRVSARLWASPHPGNEAYAQAFGARVPDHLSYINVNDVVPRVPAGFGYSALPNVINLVPGRNGVGIENNANCNHHAACYGAMTDPSTAASNLAALPASESAYTSCVRLVSAQAA